MARPRRVPAGARLLRLALLAAAFAFGAQAEDAPEDAAAVYGRALLRTWAAPNYPRKAAGAYLSGSVSVRVIVGPAGTVTNARVLDSTDPLLDKPALEAAGKWTFSPALEAGRPAACSMDALVVFSDKEAARKRKSDADTPPESEIPTYSPVTPAVLSSSPDINYPDALFDRKLAGWAHFKCRVLSDGTTADPVILACTHVEFVAPALAAVTTLHYTPRMQGDLPLASDTEGELKYDLLPKDAAGDLAANHITTPAGAGPSAHFSPRFVVDPVWPTEDLLKGQGGNATIAYTVGKEGVPHDITVTAASAPEFGAAAAAAVAMTVFTNPTLDGHSVEAALQQRFDFTPGTPDDPNARLVAAVQANQVGGSKGLDQRLRPLYRVAPEYPEALKSQGRPAGQATVDFIIDREGRCRLPRTVSASAPEFGWAAVAAVSQWVFAPPQRGGQPTDVRVRIPFEFKPPAT